MKKKNLTPIDNYDIKLFAPSTEFKVFSGGENGFIDMEALENNILAVYIKKGRQYILKEYYKGAEIIIIQERT